MSDNDWNTLAWIGTAVLLLIIIGSISQYIQGVVSPALSLRYITGFPIIIILLWGWIHWIPRFLFFLTVAEWTSYGLVSQFGLTTLILGLIYFGSDYTNKIRTQRKQELIKAELHEKRMKALSRRKEYEKKQKTKGLVNFKGKWGTPAQIKKWKEIDVGLTTNFQNMSPFEFEDFIGKLFKKMGYKVEDIVATGDFGADLVARKGESVVVIQCKRYRPGNLVTPGEVQRTLGAMHYRKYRANKAIIVTTSDFTVRAKDLENEAPIELWDKNILHKMVKKYFIEK